MSALDVHVGSHIFQRAIMEYLLKQEKTVILVTHHLQYMPDAHQVCDFMGHPLYDDSYKIPFHKVMIMRDHLSFLMIISMHIFHFFVQSK